MAVEVDILDLADLPVSGGNHLTRMPYLNERPDMTGPDNTNGS